MVVPLQRTPEAERQWHELVFDRYRRDRASGLYVDHGDYLEPGPELKLIQRLLHQAAAQTFVGDPHLGDQLYLVLPGQAIRCPGQILIRGEPKPCRGLLYRADSPAVVWVREMTTPRFPPRRAGRLQVRCPRTHCGCRFELDLAIAPDLSNGEGATGRPR